ncbi:cyclic nucleotide-binding domain-containing protein [Desulfoferrobacter suflitae]|uniref:cyclic nucleotide-binding domain-containing protein n=1 Tax=Desulfoferrobacter suflitae TaxID=2865782 RepID=UPI0021641860|nr:cyclic nucleotide-binding domain-containing protein [Desulfoferrobacter suflitae]MCK8601674.1 cyclic nucleotide-binding domain-containing protein [Desulfoferrobacter suflitae]
MNSSTEQKRAPSEYQSNLEILMQIPMFSGIPIEPLKLMAYLCKREIFRPGEIIFQQHEMDENAYFIIEGKARLILENDIEEEISEFGESAFIGGLSMFYGMKRLFTLKAVTQVTALMLSREKFQKTLEQFPEVIGKVFEGLVKTVYEWEIRLVGDRNPECAKCRANIGVTLV